jgi:glucose-6-phosphate isomerase
LQINTYDQPGVESGKIILKEKIKKIKDFKWP